MGLDFSWPNRTWQNAPKWSYGGFNRFRERLAGEAGFQLQDFWKGEARPLAVRDDPIEPLLNHSDCDGSLTPSQCRRVAPRLRELIASWSDDDYDKQMGLLLASAMEECDELVVNLIFC